MDWRPNLQTRSKAVASCTVLCFQCCLLAALFWGAMPRQVVVPDAPVPVSTLHVVVPPKALAPPAPPACTAQPVEEKVVPVKPARPAKKSRPVKAKQPIKKQVQTKPLVQPQEPVSDPLPEVTPPAPKTTVQNGPRAAVEQKQVTAEIKEEAVSKDILSKALAELVAAIERYKKYPRAARRAGYGGRVLIHVSISQEGVVESVSLQESSGKQRLDKAALYAAEQLVGQRAITVGLPERLSVAVPIRFRLK